MPADQLIHSSQLVSSMWVSADHASGRIEHEQTGIGVFQNSGPQNGWFTFGFPSNTNQKGGQALGLRLVDGSKTKRPLVEAEEALHQRGSVAVGVQPRLSFGFSCA